ncbi:hypothetical protein KAR48_16975 [bacterium]|nr:hypothetical protein [bacterium]
MFKNILKILLFCAAGTVYGANIFIWDNDNSSTFWAYERNSVEGCETGLYTTLSTLGHSVTKSRNLPDNLSNYDILFITLGFFCPS